MGRRFNYWLYRYTKDVTKVQLRFQKLKTPIDIAPPISTLSPTPILLNRRSKISGYGDPGQRIRPSLYLSGLSPGLSPPCMSSVDYSLALAVLKGLLMSLIEKKLFISGMITYYVGKRIQNFTLQVDCKLKFVVSIRFSSKRTNF